MYGRKAKRSKARSGLSWCALSPPPRRNNASLQECDGRWTIEGDPTEGALIVAARKAGLKSDALESRFARVGEVPFSSERKLMSTVHTDAEEPERLLVLTKGAPDILLARCSNELVGEQAVRLTEERCGDILAENEDLAATRYVRWELPSACYQTALDEASNSMRV